MKYINSFLGLKQLHPLSIRFIPTLVIKYVKYLLMMFLGTSSFSAFSQSILEYDIPSPSVGSLLRVQTPSVDLYTGRPSISIPLYSITFKDFSYDIQLIYNAEGNKVDLPVGNVGLGWSITGGQIYRITNGYPDEIYTISEYSDRTEIPDWNLESNLYKYYEPLTNNEDFLREPDLDEFIINIGKINASFYMYRDKTGHIKTKISSQNSPYFEVKDVKIGKIPEFLFVENEWKHPYTGRVYYPKLYFETRPISITEITIVDSDGVTYIFGGDINFIDLSCQYMQDHNYSNYFDKYGEQIGNHQMAWDDFHSTLFSNASTWHIKKIILPNQENIKFNYTKGNINIVESFDHHQVLTTNFMGQDIRSVTVPNHVTIPDYVNPQYYYLIDKKYDIIYPSSLESISASNGDEINFISSKRNDLKTLGHYDDQKYFLKDNYGFLLGKIQEKCCSFKLDEIRGKKDTIKLYYTDNANQRLKLDSLLINGEERYKFRYNRLLLPPYNQMLTDNWGYYNNKKYLQVVSSLNFEELYNYRQPDSTFVKAEILEKITYPTGGKTCFQYEPHTYSKIATQYPFEIKQESGITGGVRIKRITISNNDYLSQSIIKDYLYLNEDNTSSGILSVVPKYVTHGSGRIDYDFKHMSIHGNYSYYNKSSTQINWVDKFHIGYSRIIEVLSDGSKTIYSFVNHDQVKDEPSVGAFTLGMTNDLYNKYTSKGLDRGLVKSAKYCDNTGKLLKEENFTYHLDLSDCVKTINRYALMNTLPIRVSANIIYTYYPFLKKKTVIYYMNNGNIKETEEYNYNKFRLLTQTKKYTEESNNNIYEMRTKYLSDLMEEYNNTTIPNDSPLMIYDNMKSRSMLSMPIERTIMKDGHVINANVTTYKFSGNNIVKDKLYKLETNVPLSNYSSFKLLDPYQFIMDKKCLVDLEYINFDSYGNPVSIVNQKGDSIVSIWGYNGQYPVAMVKKAMNSTFVESKSALTLKNQTTKLQADYYNDVFYENFEESPKAISPGFNSEKSFVGLYTLPPTFKLNPSKRYMIDYQVFRNGRWNYVKHELENRNYTINENSYPIDDIRVYPQGAIATSYNYIPIFGLLRSKTDSRGVTESYEYDNSGRLRLVRDHNSTIIEKADYSILGVTTDYTTKYYCGVTFDNTMLGGDGTIITRLLEAGSALPPPTTLYEYSFEGWYDGTTKVTVVPNSSSITLKARFSKIHVVDIHLRSYLRKNGTGFIMLEADEEIIDSFTCPVKLLKYSISDIEQVTTLLGTVTIELIDGSSSNEEEYGAIPNEKREVVYDLKETPTWNAKKSTYYNSDKSEWDICILRFENEYAYPLPLK